MSMMRVGGFMFEITDAGVAFIRMFGQVYDYQSRANCGAAAGNVNYLFQI